MIVKLSYSILNTWSMGRYEEAVGQYLGKPLPATPQMELGQLYDSLWQRHIEATNTLPEALGGGLLTKPLCQIKYQKLIEVKNDLYILVRGMPDCTDSPTIYEFKCGKTEALSYVDRLQLDYYKFLVPSVTLGKYLCYNPYNKSLTVGVKYLDNRNAETALEHILTFGLEMIDYLKSQKLLIDYTKELQRV